MALHPEMIEWLVSVANAHVSDAVDLILKDHGAREEETQKAIVGALLSVGACVLRPEILERYTAPESLAVATMSVEPAIARACVELDSEIEATTKDLGLWAVFMADTADGIGFYEACDLASAPVEMLLDTVYLLTALRHYRDVWRKRENAVGMPAAVEATQARWEKMVQDVEAAVKRYEDAVLSNPNTRPALCFVADNMQLLRNLTAMWPESQPLPWWLNSDQLKSELSEHSAQ